MAVIKIRLIHVLQESPSCLSSTVMEIKITLVKQKQHFTAQ